VEEGAFLDLLSCGKVRELWGRGGRTYLVGDGGASCVVFGRGKKLALAKGVGAPFGERRIEASEWWRRSWCPRRGDVGAPALHRLEILPIYSIVIKLHFNTSLHNIIAIQICLPPSGHPYLQMPSRKQKMIPQYVFSSHSQV
jgi:hypothetical protein